MEHILGLIPFYTLIDGSHLLESRTIRTDIVVTASFKVEKEI